MTNEILYSFRRCPYAMRARWAILLCQKQVKLREIRLSNKPSELIKASKKATVPILVLEDGTVIDESLDIMSWAIKSSSKRKTLLNENEEKSQDIYELIKENDNVFKYHLDRYKYPNRFKNIVPEDHNHALKEILRRWEKKIEISSSEPSMHCLVWARETIADWCIWPFVRQYRLVNPEGFDNDKDLLKMKLWLNYYLNHSLYPVLMKKNKFWEYSNQEEIFPAEIKTT